MADKKDAFGAWPNMDWTKDVTKFWSQAMPKTGSGNTEMLERMQAMSRETMAFVEDRLRKDMETARQLMEAKSPTDVARIQMEFFQAVMSDYTRQAMKAAEEAGKAMQQTFGKWPGMPGQG